MILPHRKEFIHMKTAQMKDDCTSDFTEEYRMQIVERIKAALPYLTRERKEAFLERLEALAKEEAAG